MSNCISVPGKVLCDIRELVTSGQKIKAIKLLRAHYAKDAQGNGLTLRDAKLSIDRLTHEMGIATQLPTVSTTTARKIVPNSFIRAITMQMDGGEITVDLEQMEMRALMGLDSLGIEEVSRLLDLVKVLKAFSAGQDIDMSCINDVTKVEDL